MKKINSDSWHWKLHTFLESFPEQRYSSCVYFWLTVRNVCIVTLMACVVVGVTVMAIAPMGALIGLYRIEPWMFPGHFLVWFGLVCFGVNMFKKYWHETLKHKFGSNKTTNLETNKPERVNLLTEYIKAKKSKFCPILEVV